MVIFKRTAMPGANGWMPCTRLNKLRLYLRLAHQWGWLNDGQYRHVSAMVAEIGRLLGGWMKKTSS